MIIYPTGATLPENVLRFHLVFDEPPNADVVHSAVRLLDTQGQEIPHAFLDLPQGLWDSTGKTLTLLLHPGRIKSGLAASESMGMALSQGSQVTLEVNLAAFDSSGQLRKANSDVVSKKYDVTAPQYAAPNFADWQITIPKEMTQQALTIQTDRAMDYVSALSSLGIIDSNGTQQACVVTAVQGEKTIQINPLRSWQAGEYRLSFSPELEDICGNRINQPFERPNLSNIPATKAIELVFHCTPKENQGEFTGEMNAFASKA
jgi:hypothetical protein